MKFSAKEIKYHMLHMDAARLVSRMSYDQRMQQGAVIVHDVGPSDEHNIVSYGWNGMPPGKDNTCQHDVDGRLVTRPEVIHAEANAIRKLSPHFIPAETTIYCTMVPCLNCARCIVNAGIGRVIYDKKYRTTEGLDYLMSRNVQTLDISAIYINME